MTWCAPARVQSEYIICQCNMIVIYGLQPECKIKDRQFVGLLPTCPPASPTQLILQPLNFHIYMAEGGRVVVVGGRRGAATSSSSSSSPLSARLRANLLNPDKCEYKSWELRWQSVRGGEVGRRPLHCTARDSYLPGCMGPTAAMWHAYERYCHRGTLMMAINNNIAMSYLFIWLVFFLFTFVERQSGLREREKEKAGKLNEKTERRQQKFPSEGK